ncbi:MAG: hypothetical protein IPJ65_28315 [Archangiaceae bacterium]|nr:hypothetical protein [Archangiaceae bacterium]
MRCLSLVALISTAALGQVRPRELLAQARAKEAALDYQGALAVVRKAVTQGGAGAELTWQLYAAQGELAAVVGLTEESTTAFSRALNLHPTFELPPDASPRMSAPYKTARNTLGGERLTAVPSSKRLEQNRVETQLRVGGDVLQLVAAARVTPQGREPVLFTRTDTWLAYWVCDVEPCAHTVSLYDARGNVLLEVGGGNAPLLVLAPAPAAVGKPWFRMGWPYAVAGAVTAATGTVLAIRCAQTDAAFRTARDNPESHSYPQVVGLDRERWGYWGSALAAFAVTAALATVTVIFW